MTPRERYLAALSSWPHWTTLADGVVLLTGDGESRVDMVSRLMTAGPGQMCVVTGGLDAPPYCVPASKLRPKLLGLGVKPGKIILDNEAQNTREQAVNTVALAKKRNWKRLVIVASPDHMARAHLTFVRALDEAGLAEEVCVLPVITPAKWWEKPAGKDETRAELLAGELAKVDAYGDHVATWERGLEYFQHWEARL